MISKEDALRQLATVLDELEKDQAHINQVAAYVQIDGTFYEWNGEEFKPVWPYTLQVKKVSEKVPCRATKWVSK